ncbi:MAG: NAD(P)-binding oxidoreductase [Pseudomonadota bacterium]
MAHVLVIGSSQGIGKAVAEQLALRGHSVRAFSRKIHQDIFRNSSIETIRGNALESDDVAAALDGVDTVVQALGVKANLRMITGPVTLFSEATKVLLQAMQATDVRRLIAVTGFGAGDCAAAISPLQRIPFRAVLGQAYDDKTIQEQLISGSELDWMIVRPGVLTNARCGGGYQVLVQPDTWQNGVVTRGDVADYIASEVAKETLGKIKPVVIRYPFPL